MNPKASPPENAPSVEASSTEGETSAATPANPPLDPIWEYNKLGKSYLRTDGRICILRRGSYNHRREPKPQFTQDFFCDEWVRGNGKYDMCPRVEHAPTCLLCRQALDDYLVDDDY